MLAKCGKRSKKIYERLQSGTGHGGKQRLLTAEDAEGAEEDREIGKAKKPDH